MWDDVFAPMRPGLTATEADLDAAEAALGFPLPRSYRRFARACGAGLIGGEVRVHTPAPEPAADLVARAHVVAHSLALALERLAEEPGAATHRFRVEGGPGEVDDSTDDPTARACFFGATAAGGFLFWDVRQGVGGQEAGEQAAAGDGAEYAIWVLDPDLETLRYGGASLDAFCRGLFGADATALGPAAGPLPPTFAGDDAAALARLGQSPEPVPQETGDETGEPPA